MRLAQAPVERVANIFGALAIPTLPGIVTGFAIAEEAHPWIAGGLAVLTVVCILFTPYVVVRAARCQILGVEGVLHVRGWLRTVEVPAREVVGLTGDPDAGFVFLTELSAERRRRHLLVLLSTSRRALPHVRARQMRRRTELRNWVRRHGGLSARSRRDG